MSQVRSEIDRIDASLVDLIAERFGYVDRAWQLKMTSEEGAVVNWRIQQVIDRVKTRAQEKNMPPEMIEMVGAQWRNMIGWFIQFEEEKIRQALDAGKRGTGEKSDA
ncbi:chorismate mutase [Hyphomicrobium methylovorum]|uniref:chorismate mutase n=1 Tax=Hyphomicrobium methylovorum TaxID=84 RepID=UPI001FEBE294|nr:chorismate mutase [Hyphomicrobium methylovorum]